MKDPLVKMIEQALAPGRFISYGQSWQFVEQLEEAKNAVDALAKCGEAKRAVSLYELFLAGCYEKIEEADDSGGSLGMFFEELFISWIKARQKAGGDPEETVKQILRWMESDDYGFCYQIESQVAEILNKEGLQLFCKHFEDQFEQAFAPYSGQEPKRIHDYPSTVYMTATVLKNIYVARKNVRSYLALCERTRPSPQDCENIATLYKAKRKPADALAWVEKGLAIEKEHQWGNQSSYQLTEMRQELLSKLGCREDALAVAWSEFQKHPSIYTYADVMRYVTKKDKLHWHEKAMRVARCDSLWAFIDICTGTKEWEALAKRILAVEDKEIEQISHYVIEKAAKGLARKHGLAAAKVYRALAMRIVKSKKSKYYQYALEHFRKAKKLYEKNGEDRTWQYLVDLVRNDHSRKSSFIGGFETIVKNSKPEPRKSFEQRLRHRWRKQTSK